MTAQPLDASIIRAGDGQQEAVDLGAGTFMSRDVSNAYRVVTSEGDVIINTGIVFHDPAHRGGLTLKLAATQHLLDACSRENFSEVRWLESEVKRLRALLSEPS